MKKFKNHQNTFSFLFGLVADLCNLAGDGDGDGGGDGPLGTILDIFGPCWDHFRTMLGPFKEHFRVPYANKKVFPPKISFLEMTHTNFVSSI